MTTCVNVSCSVCRGADGGGGGGPSEPHTYSPRVVCENFVFFLHDAGVCALVDGVGHYGYVVVLQGDVVGVRVLQQLPVLVPAETEVGR